MVAHRFLAGGLALALASTPTTALAREREEIVLPPSKQWILNMAENKCRIARYFGEGDNLNVFYLEQWAPGKSSIWAVAGPAVDRYIPGRTVKYSFGQGGDAGEFTLGDATFGEMGRLLVSRTSVVVSDEQEPDEDGAIPARPLARLDEDRAAGIDQLKISQRGRQDIVFELGDMQRPLAAMNMCTSDLAEHWGFDLEELGRIATRSQVGNMDAVAREIQRHYPHKAERKGAQAVFHIRLNIAADGSIEDCALVNQTLAEDFDMAKHPCEAFRKHAQIEPARDSEGRPLRDYFVSTIIYEISGP